VGITSWLHSGSCFSVQPDDLDSWVSLGSRLRFLWSDSIRSRIIFLSAARCSRNPLTSAVRSATSWRRPRASTRMSPRCSCSSLICAVSRSTSSRRVRHIEGGPLCYTPSSSSLSFILNESDRHRFRGETEADSLDLRASSSNLFNYEEL
jgi:hypothetical protein